MIALLGYLNCSSPFIVMFGNISQFGTKLFAIFNKLVWECQIIMILPFCNVI